MLGTCVIKYVKRLFSILEQIKHTRPGQVGVQDETLNHKMNTFCIAALDSLFEMLNHQAGTVGVDPDVLYSFHLISYLLPSPMRMGSAVEASEEMYLLAHRIKDLVIDCLMTKPVFANMTRYEIISRLEQAFPIFSSHLTEANIASASAGELTAILRRLFDAAKHFNFEQQSPQLSVDANAEDGESYESAGSASSTQTLAPSSPQHLNMAAANGELNHLLYLSNKMFRTHKENTELGAWIQHNKGWCDHVLTAFERGAGALSVRAAHCRALQAFTGGVSGLVADAHHLLGAGVHPEQASVLAKVSTLVENMPPPERFIIGAWYHVFNIITQMVYDGKTSSEIIEHLCKTYRIRDRAAFIKYIKALLLRCEIESSFKRGTVEFGVLNDTVVAYVDLPSTFRLTDGKMVKNRIIPLSIFDYQVVVPSAVSRVVDDTASAVSRAVESTASAFSRAVESTADQLTEWRRWLSKSVCPSSENPIPDLAQIQAPELEPGANGTEDTNKMSAILNASCNHADTYLQKVEDLAAATSFAAVVGGGKAAVAKALDDGGMAEAAAAALQSVAAGDNAALKPVVAGDNAAAVESADDGSNMEVDPAETGAAGDNPDKLQTEAVIRAASRRKQEDRPIDRRKSGEGRAKGAINEDRSVGDNGLLAGKSRRKSRKNYKKTTRRNKGRKSSKTAKKSQQQRSRNSIRRRRSSRKSRK